MRRVLLISYHFPPLGGSGAQRPLRLVRHLPERGYDPIVLTGSAERADLAPHDQSLAAELPPETQVHRVQGPEPGLAKGLVAVAERWLERTSAWDTWWREGILREGAGAAKDADVLYAWMQPYATAEAVSRLADKLDKPWVADLGDPWALDERWLYTTALHRHVDRRRMRKLLSTAAAIVMSTPEAAARLRRSSPELADRPVVVVPNGYEPGDFAGPAPHRDDHAFRIVHTGSLYTDVGLEHRRFRRLRLLLQGERAPGVDFLAHSHVYLLQALKHLLDEDQTLASRIELHFAGAATPADEVIAARWPLVRLHGYLPHREAVQLMRSADLLFLPMHDIPAGRRAGVVPGKTYEYLATGRPILAAVPQGDVRDLLLRAGTAYVVEPTDVAAMAGVLRRLLSSSNTRRRVAEDVLARYDYRILVGQVAEVLDRV